MCRAFLLLVCGFAALALQSSAQVPQPDFFSLAQSVQSLSALAVQPDGKIIAAGVNYIGRFDSEGVKDSVFNPTVNNTVYCLALQPDGKILVGGEFTSLAGYSRSYLGRLNTNGTLDATFTATLNGRAQAVLLQPDGKVLVGGRMYVSPIGYTGYVLRLNTNGTADSSFALPGGVFGPVTSMALQEDGRLLIGGVFLTAGRTSRPHLARLGTNGSLDPDFNPGTDGIVTALAVQADGRILLGGSFDAVAGQSRTNLARLNPDGSLDDAFDPRVTGNSSATVYSLAVQTDGSIALGGLFTAVGGQPRQNLARILADGTLDDGFTSGANNYVYGLALQEDGRLIAAGDFGLLGGQARSRIGRLMSTAPAGQSMTFDGSTLTWRREGSGPEVWRTAFEVSTNLTQWTFLDVGTRVTGGWQISGISLPPEGRIRARGFATGGGFNASSWFVESISGRCFILAQPSSRTNATGTAAVFSVRAEGTPPLNYQWLKNGAAMQDTGSVLGSQTATLTLGNVAGADQANYSVTVSNVSGSITSSVAPLKVLDPFITSSFYTSSANAGDNATLSVTAAGTPPLSYQWLKNGAELPGATATSLNLTNLQATDIGTYAVRVSNSFGTTVSNRVTLEVNLATPDAFAPVIDGDLRGFAEERDGGSVFAGLFSTVDGQPRASIARVAANGSLDSPFNAQTMQNSAFYAVGLQTDDRILVSGGFALWDATTTNYYIARFTPESMLDAGFSAPTENSILALAQQPDGKFLAGGWGVTSEGALTGYLHRLNIDGSFDPGFDPGADSVVRALAVQPDGKILVGGGFSKLGGYSRAFVGRLNSNGSVDVTFNPGANNYVNCIAVQADGKILVGGEFTALAGWSRNRIGRLYPDGSIDYLFNPGASNYAGSVVYTMAVQADGKIIVGGEFSHLGGVPRASIGRLYPDGKSDPTFNPAASRSVYTTLVEAVGVMADGKTLVGGGFDSLCGIPRANIGRLKATEPATQTLSFDGSAITWSRSGTSPEAWRTTFEFSTNATDWVAMGAGERVPGGWRLSGMILPEGSTLRARAFVVGGNYNASCWFVESAIRVISPPVILVNDGTFGIRSNQFSFNVRAVPGQTVVIEGSTNLMDWLPLATNLVRDSVFGFSDLTSYPARFYRARVAGD